MPNQPIYFRDELLQRLKKESNMSSLINSLLEEHYKNITKVSLTDVDLELNKIADQEAKKLEERTKLIEQEERKKLEEKEKIIQEERKKLEEKENKVLYNQLIDKEKLSLDDIDQLNRLKKSKHLNTTYT